MSIAGGTPRALDRHRGGLPLDVENLGILKRFRDESG